jgi:2-polyprenyl-6-methoxyphenol hydroxylase-like FAD-dependent oxidoreductase
MGAAMAIEDAVLLAELLGRGTDVANIFRSFMSRRFQRAKYVVDTSAQLTAWEIEEWAGIHNPDARPGELFNEGIAAMIREY